MKTADPLELMNEVMRRVYKPRTNLNTWEWAAKHVRLDQRFTARPGLYDVNYTSYLKMPHEWFSDPYVEEITGCKSRQVGGTTYLANCMMYAIGEDPGPLLYVTSTLDKAQSFSEREWQPRIELSPILKALKPDDDDDFKKKIQHFKSCTSELTGSNSPANLMSRPIRYLLEDEIDTWPEDNGAQAPSINIAEASTISYAHARKILRISTPTTVTGAIWTYFLRGTQHKYHVQCPNCPAEAPRFELKFEQLNFHREECRGESGIWDLDKVRDLTSLICPNCKSDITMGQQVQMVHEGIWTQTNPGAPKRHISWHISALYSPTISWGQIAVIFLQQKDTPGGLQDFNNHYLGLPFSHAATMVTISDIERVRDSSPEYLLATEKNIQVWRAPAQLRFILMATDVQQDGFYWGHRGVCLDESSYLLGYGQASTWDDLTYLRERVYLNHDGSPLRIYKAVIDCGYMAKRMNGVYDHCIKSGGTFWPCQGRSVTHGLYQPVREVPFEHRGFQIQGIQLRDDLYKEQLYIRRIKEQAGPGWFLPRNIDEMYKKQLSDTWLGPNPKKPNNTNLEWLTKGNDHMGDVEKYLLSAIDLMVPILRMERDAAAPPSGVIDKVDVAVDLANEARIIEVLNEATIQHATPMPDPWAAVF